MADLMDAGPICRHAAQYIADHHTHIRFATQSTAARWTRARHVELNPERYSWRVNRGQRDYASMLGLIVHEIKHLEQGRLLALSVKGEWEGWRIECLARIELEQAGLGDRIKNIHRQNIADISPPPTDRDLRYVRSEMLKYAGFRYLVWLLPLRPERYWQAPLASLVFPPLGPLLAYYGIP